jgi:hypothetical protein
MKSTKSITFFALFFLIGANVSAIELSSLDGDAVEWTNTASGTTSSGSHAPGHYSGYNQARFAKANYYCLHQADGRVAGQYREDVQDNGDNGGHDLKGNKEMSEDYLRDGVPRYLHCNDEYIQLHRRAEMGLDPQQWRVTWGNTRFYHIYNKDDLPPTNKKMTWNYLSSANRRFKKPYITAGQCPGCSGCDCGKGVKDTDEKNKEELIKEQPKITRTQAATPPASGSSASPVRRTVELSPPKPSSPGCKNIPTAAIEVQHACGAFIAFSSDGGSPKCAPHCLNAFDVFTSSCTFHIWAATSFASSERKSGSVSTAPCSFSVSFSKCATSACW